MAAVEVSQLLEAFLQKSEVQSLPSVPCAGLMEHEAGCGLCFREKNGLKSGMGLKNHWVCSQFTMACPAKGLG